MKTSLKSLLMGAAGIALLFASCTKDNENNAPLNNKGLANVNAVESCTLVKGTANTTGTSRSDYGQWSATDKTLTWAGGSNPEITFEGQYGSFVRAKSSNWYIGTIDLADTCKTWDEIAPTIEVKNNAANLGTAPSTGVFTKYNVVGATGTVSGSFFNAGYYGYVIGVPTVQKAVVIWKDTSPGSGAASYDSDVASLSAPEAYVVRIYSFVPGGSGVNLTGTASYGYKRIL